MAACNAAPGATVAPTAPPSAQPPVGSPTQAPTNAPTFEPTPTTAPTPSFGEGQISHPTGGTDIVLRMEQGGGFMPMESNLVQAPQFTLYGDGTVVFKPMPGENAPFMGGTWEPWLTGKMTEDGVQALLQYALGTGRLANAKEVYEDNMCADCPTTWFNVNAGGVEKLITVHALAEALPGQGDAADRSGMNQLAQLLNNFETEAQAGTVENLAAYEPQVYKVVLLEAMGGQPSSEPLSWPWNDLTPADFPSGDEAGGIRMMTSEEVASIAEVPNGGASGIWVEAPDGELMQMAARPLLPDEQAAVEGA
jgi:hypothetical protein